MENYEIQYFNAIKSGLENTITHDKGESIHISSFMVKLLNETSRVGKNNGTIFFIGNGASAAFSNHMALDWSKNGGILAHSLSDSALLTALANDYSYEEAVSHFLKIEGINKNDILVTVSSSGDSPNIVNALKYCKENEICTIGFSGLKKNNKTVQIADLSLYVPMKTYGIVECIHQIFLHLWLDKYMGIAEWDRQEEQNMNAKEFKYVSSI